MSNNIDNDRSITPGKMYPIDLAPQKITIVKSHANNESKMAHIVAGQPKSSGSSQILSHANPAAGLIRTGLAQIITTSVTAQPQMIVSGSPIMQGSQMVTQGSQIIGPSAQIISQSQLITPSGQIISPATQIISQGTQLSAHVSGTSSAVVGSIQTSVASTMGSAQVISMGGQFASGTSNLMLNSSVRTLPPTVRVLPPLPHHSPRPVLSTVNVSSASGVLVSKGVGVTSHMPRGLAAGASLAVRPLAPVSVTQSQNTQGSAWSSARGGRGALVYNTRGVAPARTPPLSAVVTLPTTSVISSSGVISTAVRGHTPRVSAPAPPRPLPLLQRNYQPAKVVGVASVGVRGVVGNSAPAQLYYEVPRAALPPAPRAPAPSATPAQPAPVVSHAYQHQPLQTHLPSAQVSVVSAMPVLAAAAAQRPSILRKRDTDTSPSKPAYGRGWEDVPAGGAGGGGAGSGGSTTMSAGSVPEEDPDLELSPRKKPRKQILSNEVRQCDYQPEEPPPSPPPVAVNPPKRPVLGAGYVCGWRSTALHFVRPTDVRRREPRPRDILAIAAQKHVLASADGWKVYHLTAQMDDLMSLESDVGSQLESVLRALEGAPSRVLTALQPHSHNILERVKGNIQRSKIVCEGIQEAREDILRVFTHRNFVSDILTRQADKRCFRKHRSQS